MDEGPFADAEVAIFWRYIASSIARLVELAATLDAGGLTWRAPAPETNSIYALTIHTMGNAEENILETLCGRPVGRRREAEFAQEGAAEVRARWRELRPQLATALAALPLGTLERACPHPRRGTIGGREVLIVVARHAAEHLGQAELTRDLWRATRAAKVGTPHA